MTANYTKRNHFVPCFYSRQWTSQGGRLCQFSRPYDKVVTKRVSPEGTGYSEDLYTEKSLPPAVTTYLEDTFLKKVDQKASDALQLLLKSRIDDLTIEQRNAWVRFIMSMMQRSPDAIASLRRKWNDGYVRSNPELEERYQSERTPNDPPTVAEFLAQTPPDVIARGAVRLIQSVMDLPRIGTHVMNMVWANVDFRSTKFSLLTSDRPVARSNGLIGADSYIGLPISPTRLFICVNKRETLDAIASAKTEDMIRQANKIVASQAERFVYGLNDKPLPFVEKHLRKKAQ